MLNLAPHSQPRATPAAFVTEISACLIGQIAAGAIVVLCLLIVLCGGPRGFLPVAAFEAVVGLLFWALEQQLRRRREPNHEGHPDA
jgi:hypothetical protein